MTHPATMSESKNARTTAFKTPVIGVDFLVVAIFCASFFSPSPVVVVVVAKAFTIPDLWCCRSTRVLSICVLISAPVKTVVFLSLLPRILSFCIISCFIKFETRKELVVAFFLLLFLFPSDTVQTALDSEAIQIRIWWAFLYVWTSVRNKFNKVFYVIYRFWLTKKKSLFFSQ